MYGACSGTRKRVTWNRGWRYKVSKSTMKRWRIWLLVSIGILQMGMCAGYLHLARKKRYFAAKYKNNGMPAIIDDKLIKRAYGKGAMTMITVDMELPNEMVTYAMPQSKEEQLVRNAMMLYPYIRRGVISHGRAAEILGIFKMDLITLYGEMGLPYIEMTDEEIEEELETVDYLKGMMA